MQRSPAQLFALVFGVVLVAAGVLGFFYNASFDVDPVKRDAVLGILDVNAWHNLVHIATGALGLALAGSYEGSRIYAYALGALYLLITTIGFIYGAGEAIAGLVPINTEDNIFHLLIGVAGLGAASATPGSPAPTTTPPAAGD